MDPLESVEWDVVIAGTGVQESLLALALSRSGKKILHVDRHDYYGGAEAALSLQEAETWAVASRESTVFSERQVAHSISNNENSETGPRLSFPRAYSLALAPQIIYTRSSLLPALVSSRSDAQLEFLAVGSWWIHSAAAQPSSSATLLRVPSGREDIFADQSFDARAKRALMKFLRFVGDYEEQEELWHEYKDRPLVQFLASRFPLPLQVQHTILALTLMPVAPDHIITSIALSRIARHLRSLGLFGPGFAALIPKWGGLSEIAQVGCRAGAVGGGVYVLNNGVADAQEVEGGISTLTLKNGEVVKTHYYVASEDNVNPDVTSSTATADILCRSISVVSSLLSKLFPGLVEGSPPPAAAVVVFPGSPAIENNNRANTSQVIITIHSADTGECPTGQSILYSCVTAPASEGFAVLNDAISMLLQSVNETPVPAVLWKLQYGQRSPVFTEPSTNEADTTIVFPALSLDLAFDDSTLDRVRQAWRTIMGSEAEDFLQFPAKEGAESDMEND